MAGRIRVLIADDHGIFRQGLQRLLTLEEGFEVVGEAGNGNEAILLAQQLRPDVLILDISLPVVNGIEVTRKVLAALPGMRVVILTMHDDQEYLFQALRAGATSYVLKDVEPGVLLDAIRSAVNGTAFIEPSMAVKLVQEYNRLSEGQGPAARRRSPLSERELEVLELMAEGINYREISRRLCITEKTVKNHSANIFRKIGVNDRTQAVLMGIKRGWIQVK